MQELLEHIKEYYQLNQIDPVKNRKQSVKIINRYNMPNQFVGVANFDGSSNISAFDYARNYQVMQNK